MRLYKGRGETVVNGMPIERYFSGELAKIMALKPLAETGVLGKYFITARLVGGGHEGQLGAFIHGVARALSLADRENFRPILKKGGFLTRDARTRERRKVGTGGKARRKKQSPKR